MSRWSRGAKVMLAAMALVCLAACGGANNPTATRVPSPTGTPSAVPVNRTAVAPSVVPTVSGTVSTGSAPAGTAAAGSVVAAGTPNVAGGVYTDPQQRYSFMIPPGWMTLQGPTADPHTVLLTPPPPLMGQVEIDVYNVNREDLNQVTDIDLAQMRLNAPQLTLSPDGIRPFAFAGKPAKTYTMVGPSSNQLAAVERYITLVGSDAYVFAFVYTTASSDAVIQARNNILGSLKFSK